MSFPDYEAAGIVFGKYVEQELRDGQHLKWQWIVEAVDAALEGAKRYRICLTHRYIFHPEGEGRVDSHKQTWEKEGTCVVVYVVQVPEGGTMNDQRICPDCGGEGGTVIQYGDGDWDGEECDVCRGTGKVAQSDTKEDADE